MIHVHAHEQRSESFTYENCGTYTPRLLMGEVQILSGTRGQERKLVML